MNVEGIITELIEIVLLQEQEIKGLKDRIERINTYITVYEDYIKGE